MTDRINIVEVGPRDGLQNEKQSINVATKVALIEQLGRCGTEDRRGRRFRIAEMGAADGGVRRCSCIN